MAMWLVDPSEQHWENHWERHYWWDWRWVLPRVLSKERATQWDWRFLALWVQRWDWQSVLQSEDWSAKRYSKQRERQCFRILLWWW